MNHDYQRPFTDGRVVDFHAVIVSVTVFHLV